MNSKSTWVWLTVAALLFAAVVAVEKFGRTPPPAIVPLLPGFRAADISSVQYTPAGQLEIRADRTTNSWQLVKPIHYPAQANSIATLLQALQQLAPMQTISGAELRQHTNADEEFGFQHRNTLTLVTGQTFRQVFIGGRTAPGDGVYVQIVGVEGVFIVDAQLLRLLPATPDNWRDTALVELHGQEFDRIAVSNATTTLQFQHDASNQLWRLTAPLAARASQNRILESLQKLSATRVVQFVTDAPTADLDGFGFQAPELELTLAHGTNALLALQFGKSPTNDSTLVYARRLDLPSVFTVERQPLTPWLGPLNDFRDPHLVTVTTPVTTIEISGRETFTLQRSATNAWRLTDSELPVDAGLVGEFLLTLVSAPIQQFKDSITAADLPQYGFAEPGRQIRLLGAPTSGNPTNVLVDLSFGAIKDGLVYVRRADENPVYAINIVDYARVAASPWQFRDRQLWRFSETNAVRITLQRGARKTEFRRVGANAWLPAPGLPSKVNGNEVAETVRRFGTFDASAWLGRGADNRARFGFDTNSLVVKIEMKDGVQHEVEFGGASEDGYPYAAIKLGDETWFFECPLVLYKYMEFVLLNPAAFPP